MRAWSGAERWTIGTGLSVLRRNVLAVPLAVVAALLGTGAWLVVRPVHYRATAMVRVRPAGPDDISQQVLTGVIAGSGQAPQTAAELIASEGVAGLTARKLGGGITAGQVAGDVTIQSGRQPEILDVEAQAPDPRLAVRVANEFTRVSLTLHLQALMRQAVRVLADTPGYARAEIAGLRSVIDGVDPTFSLEALASRAKNIDESAWSLLGLALIPGFTLGMAGALLRGFLAQAGPGTPGTGAGVAPSLAPTGNNPS